MFKPPAALSARTESCPQDVLAADVLRMESVFAFVALAEKEAVVPASAAEKVPVVDDSAAVTVVPRVVVLEVDVSPFPAVRRPLNIPVVDVSAPVPVVPRVVVPAVDVSPLPAVRSPLNEPVVDVNAPVPVVARVVVPAVDVSPLPAVRSPLNEPVVDVSAPVPVVPRVVVPTVDVSPFPAVRSPLNEPVVDVSAPVPVVPKMVVPAVDVRPAPAVMRPLNEPVVDVKEPIAVVPRVVCPATDVKPAAAVNIPLNVPATAPTLPLNVPPTEFNRNRSAPAVPKLMLSAKPVSALGPDMSRKACFVASVPPPAERRRTPLSPVAEAPRISYAPTPVDSAGREAVAVSGAKSTIPPPRVASPCVLMVSNVRSLASSGPWAIRRFCRTVSPSTTSDGSPESCALTVMGFTNTTIVTYFADSNIYFETRTTRK